MTTRHRRPSLVGVSGKRGNNGQSNNNDNAQGNPRYIRTDHIRYHGNSLIQIEYLPTTDTRTDLQEGAALIYIRGGVFSGRRPFIKAAMAGLFGSHPYRLNDAA